MEIRALHVAPFVTLVTLASAFAACASASSPAAPPGVDADAGIGPVGSETTDAGDAATGPTIPDSAAGRQLAWVLGVLNGATLSDAACGEHFTTEFLAAVAPSKLRAVMGPMAKSKPWTLRAFEGEPTASRLLAVIADGEGKHQRVHVATLAAEGDKMDTLIFQPAGDMDPALASWSGIDAAMNAIASKTTLFVGDLDSSCAPLHAKNGNDRFALGSVFKLYILAELARAVDAGERAFVDTLAIEDRYKSLPSGELQNEPVGTRLSLRTYAEKMISISDNTATDHLLFTLGRNKVEAMVQASGHHAPADNRPFLGTRELFTLKMMLTDAEQDGYVAASEAEKRTQLASFATRDPRTGAVWSAPERIDTLEWFANGEDLCKLALTLKGYGDKPATKPVYDVLAKNPGLAGGTDAFSYVGFKGGSEPGVLVSTWLLRRKADNAWRFLSIAFNDTSKPIDEARALYVAGAARALVGR